MDYLNFLKNDVLRLPPGFRFHPTDEELVVQYLKRKVFSLPLPASVIGDLDVSKFDPWNLPGNLEEERYFFSNWEVKYCNGNRSNRATSCGYWKASGLDKQIVEIKRNQIVGMKKTLVFYRGKPPHGSRTDWIMHEYRLVPLQTAPSKASPKKNTKFKNHLVPIGNWVLCRIFLKKRGRKNGDADVHKLSNTTIYCDLNLAPSSSDTSEITEISADENSDDQDENCNSLSYFRKKSDLPE